MSYILVKKRSPPQRINSPTNQTSSPVQKRASFNAKSNSTESTSNEPGPMVISPQRDKHRAVPQDYNEEMEQAEPGPTEQDTSEQGEMADQQPKGQINDSRKSNETTNNAEVSNEVQNSKENEDTEMETVDQAQQEEVVASQVKENNEIEDQRHREDDQEVKGADSKKPRTDSPSSNHPSKMRMSI